MLAKIYSGTVDGVNGLVVDVEVDIAAGLPNFTTVGLPEAAVRESKDRVKAAIKNSGYAFPAKKITVNLAPADLRKVGTAYDLPIAIGILAASEILRLPRDPYLFLGELSLDGSVRPVTGVLPIVFAARSRGFAGVLVPRQNAKEAAVVEGIKVLAADTLSQVVSFLSGHQDISPETVNVEELFKIAQKSEVDLSDVKGQEHAKRALEIAAAGGHNLLFEGVPGSGKTMLARRLPTILPDMTLAESLETTKIYSVAGLNRRNGGIIATRPFRAPHHNISDAGLIGGGQIPRPGEVSLAHNGVLFLDELAEFKKHILEGLRQPLEDGNVTISRAASSMNFPANFLMIAAINPCPCGFLNDPKRECVCTPTQVERYKNRLSGPLLDRIDIHIDVPAVPFKDLTALRAGETSETVKERVTRAREIQKKRFLGSKGIYSNSQMSTRDLNTYCPLQNDSRKLLENSIDRLGLSARAFQRIRKIARTIADLEGVADIALPHVAEAVQYRRASGSS